jgi:hypothetical protein
MAMIWKGRGKEKSFVSKSTSFIELSKIYHENIIDLCDETLSTVAFFSSLPYSLFTVVCERGSKFFSWVEEVIIIYEEREQCQESIPKSALRMFK